MLENIQASNYTIKQILKDAGNWEEFCRLYGDDIRPTVIENVEKVMNCGDKDKLGHSVYVCPTCSKKHIVAHTCKSRFCNSCGKVRNDNWLLDAENKLLNVPHKHLIFTIPSELWLIFRR